MSGNFRVGLFGTIVGAAAGFALGMILAPEEGKKLRRRIAFHLEKTSAQLGEFIESFGDEAELSEARQMGESLVADVQERARKIQDDMDELLSSIPDAKPVTRST